jgi:sRNA-binding protein
MAFSKSQARAHAAIAQLAERFPAVFTQTGRRPLKIGIHGELLALGFDRKLVVVALRSYCGSSGYLSALREGAARIGLDGQPTGVVTAEEEKIAAAQLTGKIARATAEGAKPALEVTVRGASTGKFGRTSPALVERPSRAWATPQGVRHKADWLKMKNAETGGFTCPNPLRPRASRREQKGS